VSTHIPLVGRELEMTRLRIALDEAIRGEGQFVVVQGEAGVGKSRLVAELATEALKVDCCVLLGHCYEAEQILPFGAWVDALRTGGITEAMELLRSLPSSWRRELARLLPELDPRAADSSFGSPDHLRLFEAMTELLRGLAARQPVVLILEDLHWADEMTLRLLTFLSHRLQGRPVLLVSTAREEELIDLPMLRRTLEELDREAHVTRLELASLSQANTVDLVRLLARPSSTGSDLVQLGEEIWRTSEGNPFVVVETMRAVNQGLASPGSANSSLPGRVREVIARRLDRLSELSRQLLAVAAVFGREFEFELLRRAAEIDEREAADGIEELVRRHLLQAVGNRFDFTHDRIREVVYGRVLSPRRKRLHRLVAKAMESLYSAELERHHLALAVHYRAGEVWDRARTHFRQAGITAFLRGAFRDSVACFQQARGLPCDLPNDARTSTLAIDLRFNLHHSLWALGDMKSVLGCLGEAALLAHELGDEVRQGRAAAYECHYWWTSGDNVKALRPGDEARTLAAKAGDPVLLAETNFSRGLVCQAMGQYRSAADLFLANLAIIDTNRAVMARAFRVSLSGMYLARCLAELGDFADGLKFAGQCVELAESSGGPFSISGAYFGLGDLHLRKGDAPAAISVLEQGMAVCLAHSVENAFPATAAALGYAYLLAGRGGEALPLLEQALHRARAMGVFASYAQKLIYLAEGYLLVGETAKAHQCAQQALQHARAHLERGYEAQAVRLLADILLRHDPPDTNTVRASYRHAISAAEELGMRPLLARCHFELGLVSHGMGDGQNGTTHLRTAADLFREMGMDAWLTRAESCLREGGESDLGNA
jgi:tetratricopeptide (TPR) repeat protein